MLAVLAGLMVVAGLATAALAVDVARRRGAPAGISLAVLLLAVAWWGLAYAVELSVADLDTKSRWGDLKYAGIVTLPPALLTFVLQYTGRGRLVTRRLVLALAVEPVAVVAVLAVPATHDLVRFYPPSAAGQELPVVASGPLFWVHLGYAYLLVVVATTLFVVTMVRVSRLYWRMAAVLIAAAVAPWLFNALYNFGVGPFARIDLTPFAFVVTGAVLVWGLFRERLVNLMPVARSVVVETMADGVLVLDAFGRVVDANPAAARVLGTTGDHAVGRPLADLLQAYPDLAAGYRELGPGDAERVEVTLTVDGAPQHFDVRRQLLPDRTGRTAGELFVLRDITDRRQAETQLRELLGERTRIAAALQGSLLPAVLPPVEGISLAARYGPAGDGREIGGDFYDVFPLHRGAWAVVLGDVSGKGAEAAAVTALVRYTLRALADERGVRQVLRSVNDALLRQGTDERFCTLVYLVVEPPDALPGRRVTVWLAGHLPPLLRRACGEVEALGRLGTALGLLPEPELHEVTVRLGHGDLVCLFTDGLVEARRDAEQYGEERVAAVLAAYPDAPPADLAVALEQDVRRYRGRQLADDLAILLLAVDGAGRPEPAGVGQQTAAAGH